ncbi:unnamed protein product, partial [Toxocara canis]|uniref:Dynein light chain n=1 Tax=Toxocara canis TaxID=6265 RepID=A0A183TYZ0_TOXCA
DQQIPGKKSPGAKVAGAVQATEPPREDGPLSDTQNPTRHHVSGGKTLTNVLDDNCKSEKLKELILETIGLFPHQYSYQARYMKQQAEDRFGNWWSAVIISEKGGYGMSAVYDQYTNTTYVIFCLFKRTSFFYKIFISPNHMSENHLFICSLYLFLLQNGSHVDV